VKKSSNPPALEIPDKSDPSVKRSLGQSPEGSDVVLVHGVTEDKKGLRVLRSRAGSLEVGEVRPIVEGQPIHSDVVRLRPRKEAPFLCDVETTYSPGEKNAPRKTRGADAPEAGNQAQGRAPRVGPPQVASRAYRDNWEQIYRTRVTGPGSSDIN
jgi:hypothetical protein